MSGQHFFEHLFHHSKQITPYLQGSLAAIRHDDSQPAVIHIDTPSSETIHELYQNLKLAHPEAGAPYWLTRTWTLLCWQPIYVAFISIYACQGLPKLSAMAQQVHPEFIGGYQFESCDYYQGDEQQLIELAGRELGVLFGYYRQQITAWSRIRPGFTDRLLADGILACLVKLSQYAPHLPEEYLLEQARLWLKACGLADKLLTSIRYDAQTKQLRLIRTSCCLVYKCQGRKLCLDCPRHPDNKPVRNRTC